MHIVENGNRQAGSSIETQWKKLEDQWKELIITQCRVKTNKFAAIRYYVGRCFKMRLDKFMEVNLAYSIQLPELKEVCLNTNC